jgi:hypothetical protein
MQLLELDLTADGNYIIPIEAIGLPYNLTIKGEPDEDDDGEAAWGSGTIQLLAPLSPSGEYVKLMRGALTYGDDERSLQPITSTIMVKLTGATNPNLRLTLRRVQANAPF